jgi:hypothetical protein
MDASQARAQVRHYLELAHKLGDQPDAERAREMAAYYMQHIRDLEEPTYELKRASGARV